MDPVPRRHFGREFRRFKYFDFEVIQDVDTGYINAGGFVLDVARINKIKKDIDKFKHTDNYREAIEYGIKMIREEPPRKSGGSSTNVFPIPIDGKEITEELVEKVIFHVLNNDCKEEEKGTYVPFKVFQLVALWADSKHKMAVINLLEKINEKANTLDVSAYTVLNETIQKLDNEITELKEKHEALEREHAESLKLLENFNSPKNQTDEPPMIYAKKINDDYFQLKYQSNTVNKNHAIRYVQMINARVVKEEMKKELTKQGLIVKRDRKHLISMKYLDYVFQLALLIKNNARIELPSPEERNKFIRDHILKYKSMKRTQNIEGLIYEYETLLKYPSYIPWKAIPVDLLNKMGENRADNGIDGVEFNDNKTPRKIIQIKHHNGGYLRREEIQTFVNKSQIKQYKDCEKILIVHGCKISKKFQAEIESFGIVIEIEE